MFSSFLDFVTVFFALFVLCHLNYELLKMPLVTQLFSKCQNGSYHFITYLTCCVLPVTHLYISLSFSGVC